MVMVIHLLAMPCPVSAGANTRRSAVVAPPPERRGFCPPSNQLTSLPSATLLQGTSMSGKGGVVRDLDAEEAVAATAEQVAALSVKDEVRKEAGRVV